ncbi:DNA-binding transcription factor [Lithospermum erythrorhizon]|uniref:DNA-binding transcription factor n=1 Tax=Lithospermum erythrorhizon TaxID=34254 RepID=A0AAV3PA40_LITER
MDDDERTPFDANNSSFTTLLNSHQLESGYYEESESNNFEVSDLLEFVSNECSYEYQPIPTSQTTPMIILPEFSQNPDNLATGSSTNSGVGGNRETTTKKRFAFRTKSQVEILDDGFKWRKYGKKMVKNSPNPRNYYRCSVDGCKVKKRVERDKDDPTYIITTYEGTHTHPSPGEVTDLTNNPPTIA